MRAQTRKRYVRAASLVLIASFGPVGRAQTSTQPAPASAAAPHELPSAILAQLDQIEDFTQGLDPPGFYEVAEFVKRASFSPGSVETPVPVADWRDFLDRPRSLRGVPVTVEGVVGRNKDPWGVRSRPELGQFGQLELQDSRSPGISVTVVCTNAVSDVPVNSTVRVTGYFLKTRVFTSESGRQQNSAVLLAVGPTDIGIATPRVESDRSAFDWKWVLVAVGAALVLVWFILRRATRPGHVDLRSLRAQHAPNMNLSGDLAEWAGAPEPAGGSAGASADEPSNAP